MADQIAGERPLCGFVECAVVPGTSLVSDDRSGYARLAKRGYKHLAIAERGDPHVAEEYLPIIHLVFANLKTWLNGTHHGVSYQHLQASFNEFTFRFNRRLAAGPLGAPSATAQARSEAWSEFHLLGNPALRKAMFRGKRAAGQDSNPRAAARVAPVRSGPPMAEYEEIWCTILPRP